MAAPPLYSRLGYLSGRAVPTGSVTISDVTNGANIYGVAPLNSGVGESLRSNRDLAMIAILLGCGLRRAELASLRMEDVQIRQGHWAIVDLVGKGVLSVPLDAVDGLGTSVQQAYLIRSGELHLVKITTGLQTATRVEVLSGLRDGDQVVVGRHSGLADGEKVNARPASYESNAS